MKIEKDLHGLDFEYDTLQKSTLNSLKEVKEY